MSTTPNVWMGVNWLNDRESKCADCIFQWGVRARTYSQKKIFNILLKLKLAAIAMKMKWGTREKKRKIKHENIL